VIEKMERETGVEPATSSLGIRRSIANKDYAVFGNLILAMKSIQFSI